MKKIVIQLETNLDLIDMIKIIKKYEDLGAVRLESILEGNNEQTRT